MGGWVGGWVGERLVDHGRDVCAHVCIFKVVSMTE